MLSVEFGSVVLWLFARRLLPLIIRHGGGRGVSETAVFSCQLYRIARWGGGSGGLCKKSLEHAGYLSFLDPQDVAMTYTASEARAYYILCKGVKSVVGLSVVTFARFFDQVKLRHIQYPI